MTRVIYIRKSFATNLGQPVLRGDNFGQNE